MASEATKSAGSEEAPPGLLTVQGEGSLTVPFDKVKLHVQITCKSDGVNTATVAQTQNQDTVGEFMVALEDELGIGKANLKTGTYAFRSAWTSLSILETFLSSTEER